MNDSRKDELLDDLKKMRPDENDPKVERGDSTYFGVELIDGKMACAACKTVEPKAQMVMHADGREFFSWTYQCPCGNYITVRTRRAKNDLMRHA